MQLLSGMSHLLFAADPHASSLSTTYAVLGLAVMAFCLSRLRFGELSSFALVWMCLFGVGQCVHERHATVVDFSSGAITMAVGDVILFICLTYLAVRSVQEPVSVISTLLFCSALVWVFDDLIGGWLLSLDPHAPLFWALGFALIIAGSLLWQAKRYPALEHALTT